MSSEFQEKVEGGWEREAEGHAVYCVLISQPRLSWAMLTRLTGCRIIVVSFSDSLGPSSRVRLHLRVRFASLSYRTVLGASISLREIA